jgi:hypothetical protein
MAAKLITLTHKIAKQLASSGTEQLQFSLQAASPGTFGYPLVHSRTHIPEARAAMRV